MHPRGYALEPLVGLRHDEVEAATAVLATAVTGRDLCEKQRQAAEQLRDEHDARAERVRDAERASFARNGLRAEDLARADAWEAGRAAERERLSADIARRRKVETDACGAEARAREALARCKANAKVIDEDRERWSAAQKRTVEAREEEEAAEAYRPR